MSSFGARTEPETKFWRRHKPAQPRLMATLFRFDNRQPLQLGKMPAVERGHAAAPFQGGGRHDQVVETHPPATRFQFRPKAGVFVSRQFRAGKDGQRSQNGLEVWLTLCPVRPGSPSHALPEFGQGDECDPIVADDRILQETCPRSALLAFTPKGPRFARLRLRNDVYCGLQRCGCEIKPWLPSKSLRRSFYDF